MDIQPILQISKRFYSGLLNLYPREHRAEYGADMLQLFADQCKAIKNFRELLALWLRTLVDLGISAFREQLAPPHRTLGLLEAPLNGPLPWKGVALVLIPGMIFFIGQVTQLTGQDWFFLLVYRGAFFLIIPVVAVWAGTRKFPIWGMIPLGLLARTVLTLSRHAIDWLDQQRALHHAITRWNASTKLPLAPYDTLLTVVLSGALLLCLGLLAQVIRRAGIPRRVWMWLGIYLLFNALKFTLTWQTFHIENNAGEAPLTLLNHVVNLQNIFFDALLFCFGFLALILCGALLSRQHGQLAILLPLGFLLPAILFGRITDEWPGAGSPDFTFVMVASAGALIYRFLVALAGPVWIVRSARGEKQKRSSAIALMTLITIQAICNLVMMAQSVFSSRQASDIYLAVSDQLISGAGILLALAFYRPGQKEPIMPRHQPQVEPNS